MSDQIRRSKELAQGGHNYDGWRLRNLDEEKSHGAKTQLVEHVSALQVVQKKIDKGDIAGATAALREIQKRIGVTIDALK